MRPFTTPRTVAECVALLPNGSLHGEGGARVEGISLDSRRVEAGDLFVALPGTQADGHRFVPRALEKGAVAILGEDPTQAPPGVPYIEVRDGYAAMATLASALYGDPSRAIPVVGVTGTNGKTTVTYLLEAILGMGCGLSPLVMGTVNYRQGAWTREATHTTPDAIDVQALLAERVMRGATHALLEVSSHAIVQRRVDGVHFDVGIFTSFSRDHLDYHGTMEAYFEAKARLFTERLPKGGKGVKAAVLCLDAPGVPELAKAIGGDSGVKVMTYALENGPAAPDLWVESYTQDLTGAQVTIAWDGGSMAVRSPLLGRFNLQNLLGAVGGAIALGVPIPAIQGGLAAAKAVPGRLEPVGSLEGIGLFVDYAHTPEALERVLKELRAFSEGQGRLIVVFGAGGDRDQGKRPQMGRVAAENADCLVITTDNPRTEAPDSIIEGILEGVPEVVAPVKDVASLGAGGGPSCWVEVSRRRAILGAISVLKPGDVCLIAGKGHETYQEIGHTRIPFDDRAIAREGLAALEGVAP